VSQAAVTTPVSDAPGVEVRQRILDAAEAVFAERGYGAATTREIASAGIGKRMLFYYFASEEAVYRAVLDRVVGGMVVIHHRFRTDPGPVGLAEAMEGITLFAAANLPAVRVLTREIMDEGPHMDELVHEHIAPLFAAGAAEVARNMEQGIFRSADPMHVLVHVAGVTLYYFQMLPLLERVWNRDPLAPATLAERAAAVRDCLLYGLLHPAAKGEASS
jgi:TetR/AcrR family transcriptional regulator